MHHSRAMKTIPILLGVALASIPLVASAGPPTIVCRLHPLARLSRSVPDSVAPANALARFEAYADRNGPSGPGTPVVGSYRPAGSGDAMRAPGRIIFVEDLWTDRALRLTLWFDGDDWLTGRSFVCG